MDAFNESAQLILRTQNATANTNLGNDFTWNNINLRLLMGDMYDRYDKFNLVLSSFAMSNIGGTVGSNLADLALTIEISGLPFINQTYDPRTNNNTNWSTVNFFRVERNNSVIQQFNNAFLTFGKSQDMCNINIRYTRITDRNPPSTPGSAPYPSSIFDFYIVGIPNDSDKTLTPPERMDKNRGFLK